MTTASDARMMAHLVNALEPHGVGGDRLVLRYEEDLQDYDVLVLGGDLTDAQIEGLYDATRLGGCVRFAEPGNTARWNDHLRREGAARLTFQAAELRRLHPDLPRFAPSTDTLSAFARSLELWSGLDAGSALKVTGEHTITIDFQGAPPDFDRVQALMQAVTILAEYDIEVQMIGRSSV